MHFLAYSSHSVLFTALDECTRTSFLALKDAVVDLANLVWANFLPSHNQMQHKPDTIFYIINWGGSSVESAYIQLPRNKLH